MKVHLSIKLFCILKVPKSFHLRQFNARFLSFVPKHEPFNQQDFICLLDFMARRKRILLITGAGISTESGIPDYRSENVGLYASRNYKPVQYQEFVKSAEVRKRYWARNFVGWPTFSAVKPNAIHDSLTVLEKEKRLLAIITQNVDNLHQKSGSKNVIELHGTGFVVKCLKCPYQIDRMTLQQHLLEKNPNIGSHFTKIRPDGDVELSVEQVENFQPPSCPKCSSPLKPDIVFFGDNVPKDRVEKVNGLISESDSILVLGSSLTVYSSYRIVSQAKNEGKPVAVVNIGPTRADSIVDLKVSAKCGDIIPKLCDALVNS